MMGISRFPAGSRRTAAESRGSTFQPDSRIPVRCSTSLHHGRKDFGCIDRLRATSLVRDYPCSENQAESQTRLRPGLSRDSV